MSLKRHNTRALHDPDAPLWVEPLLAHKASGISVNTIRSWVRRGRISAACELATGLLHVNLVEVKARATRNAEKV